MILTLRRALCFLFLLSAFSTKFSTEASVISQCRLWLQKLEVRSRRYSFTEITRATPVEVYDLYLKENANPHFKLRSSEIKILRAKKHLRQFKSFQKASRFFKKTNIFVGIYQRSKPKMIFRRSWRKIFDFWKISIPITPSYRRFRRDRIYRNLLSNIHWQPREIRNRYQWLSDREFLNKFQLESDFERYRHDLQLHPRAFRNLAKIRSIRQALKWGLITSVLLLNATGFEYLSATESFDERSPRGMSRYDEKVELLFLSPMPHASIKIRGNIYNYGIFQVSRTNLRAYHQTAGFGRFASGNYTRVEIKASHAEIMRLQNLLEQDVLRTYPLTIPWVDCVSETNLALFKSLGISIPPVANRSQAMTIAYLRWRKLQGDPRIGAIRFASENDSPVISKTADLGVNTMDTYLFFEFAPSVFVAGSIWDHYGKTKSVLSDIEEKTAQSKSLKK